VIKNLSKIIRNDQGSVYILTLAVSGIMVAVGLGMTSLMASLDQTTKYEILKQAASELRESMFASLDNDASWENIVTRNSSMSCLNTDGAVCPAGPQSFAVYDMPDVLVMGNTMDGDICSNFGSATGVECPFQYALTWECTTNPCAPTVKGSAIVAIEPKLRIRGVLSFVPRDPKTAGLINLQKQSIDMIRGTNSKTLSRFCNSVDGIFDQVSQTCKNIHNTTDVVNCSDALGIPANFVRFVGYDNTGNAICAPDPKLNAYCAEGTAVVAVRANGTLQCGTF